MEININNYHNYRLSRLEKTGNKKESKNLPITEKQVKTPLPSTQYMLSFCGGKSLNLEDTVKQIDKLGKFPDGIKEASIETIEKGNPDKKTLIDIHKAKYRDLYSCDTLEEAKFFFPEFKDVLSDTQVSVRNSSFIDAVRKGEVPYFDKDKDVTLQLLQMYWGEGISLSEFEKEFAGRNIHGVFKKLNIPLCSPIYGHYLALSDQTKNNHFAEAMRNRQRNSDNAAKSTKESEYLPRGPLSESHKAKISESLKKYYEQHPDIAFHLSEKQIKYFEENPEQKDVFSQVLLRAWRYPEAKSIKKALSKHMKKQNVSEEELSDIFTNNTERKNIMQAFWDRNAWAKDRFSVCMTKSWDRQRYLSKRGLIYEPIYSLKVTPRSQDEKLKAALGENFVYVNDYMNNVLIPDLRDKIQNTEEAILSLKLSGEYYHSHNDDSIHCANVKAFSILDSVIQIYKSQENKGIMENPEFNQLLHIAKNLPRKANELNSIFLMCVELCVRTGHRNWADIFAKSTDKIDDMLLNNPDKKDTIIENFSRLFLNAE